MTELTLDDFRRLATGAPDPTRSGISEDAIRGAILIRQVEQTFLELFAAGRMNGTVHTCTGQEFSAVAVAGQLRESDWVSSNHRCHGHFIARTGNWRGLIDELMGLKSGVCSGVGSSQHLFAPGFLSNGVQGSLLPVASGIGLHQKRTGSDGIVVSFIGEGTFGEGVLYEAWNLAALWGVPQLFVCENNLYSQSTPQPLAVAGTLRGRASAFGIKTFECNTWDLPSLFATAREAIEDVRERQAPALLIVRTYRLNAHSKGDDDRTQNEVRFFQAQDPLNRLLGVERWQRAQDEIKAEVAGHVEASRRVTLDVADYVGDQLPRYRLTSADDPGRPVENERVRLVHALNRAYKARVEAGAVMLGEDIHDPYGGAFKVTKGIAEAHRDRVYTTPISEAGIAGIGAGLALMGQRAFVEIMFGDFTTNIFDQLINNISKFHHMYAKQASVPIRIRTPMGGKRGYGPTHSQSLEKYLVGIDNLTVMAVTSLEDPFAAIKAADELPGPVFIVESKLDYGRFLWQPPAEYACQKVGPALGTLVISPRRHAPTVTVVSYGETARELAEGLIDLFVEADEVIELVVPLLLHPLPLESILRSVMRTGNLLVVEDGSVPFGIGSEVIASLVEAGVAFKARRLGAEPVPIPSVLELEKQVLPSARRVLQELLRAKGGSMQ